MATVTIPFWALCVILAYLALNLGYQAFALALIAVRAVRAKRKQDAALEQAAAAIRRSHVKVPPPPPLRK
jgi:hypothetical protein